MSNQDLEYLFRTGAGMVPPYLAGRKQEQKLFQKCIRALKNRKPPGEDMIVYGPRGNGKTALLRYLEKETLQKEESKLVIQWETPDVMRTLEELIVCLIADNKKIWEMIETTDLTVSGPFIKSKTTLNMRRPLPAIKKIIRERCKEKPLILIIDEAHTLDPEVGYALLNASQMVSAEGYPFLLVLAGTPNLRATLAKANASFWERSGRLSLGRLMPEEARQAITIPLEKVGVSFAPGVAEEVVERTDSYPYFTQVWGYCLAMRLHETGARVISIDTVKEVAAEVKTKCDAMFQDRRNEIIKMGLLAVAESVADAFIQSGETNLHGSVLEEAIERGMAGDEPITNERIMKKHKQLIHLGYVWQVNHPKGLDYEPGIPSLMSYVNDRAPAHQTKLAKESRLTGIDMDFGIQGNTIP